MALIKTMHLMPSLRKIEYYSRKGERRQFAFISNECFDLALKLSFIDYSLSASERQFWHQQIEKFGGQRS